MKIHPTDVNSEIRQDIYHIIENGDYLGGKTEAIIRKLMEAEGYEWIDGKYGSKNGYDGVYIKGTLENPTETIIMESKQFKYTRDGAGELEEFTGVSLGNPNTRLPRQMSDGWIRYIAGNLTDSSSTQLLGEKILEWMDLNREIIKKYVSAIDRKKMK
jgi:hypothetical protein